MYSAVVLDKESRSKLLSVMGTYVPDDWEKIAHHMTINMGPIKPELERYLGMTVPLRVKEIGISEKAFAVKVEGFPTTNKIPHITIAIDRKGGGKPVMSNLITDWRPIQLGFDLKGTVKEIK